MIKTLLLMVLLLPTAAHSMTAHFIDVGQGDATLLEFSCGVALIDAGGEDSDTLPRYLEEFFKNRPDLNKTLDVVFVTHTHLDHNRALREVVETYRVKNYVHNGVYNGSGRWAARWMNEYAKNIVKQISVTNKDITSLEHKNGLTNKVIDPIKCEDEDPEIRVLYGPHVENPGWSNADFNNGNNRSIVIRVDYDDFSMLFTGDLEDTAIEDLVKYYRSTKLLDVDLYQVGHHGADNGTTISLLKAMTPDMAVISMGKWTSGRFKEPGSSVYKSKLFTTYGYGHPRRRIVEWLQLVVANKRAKPVMVYTAEGAADFKKQDVAQAVYATGWDGTIRVGILDDNVVVGVGE